MAETLEQLMIRLGYDASQVDRGTLAMLDKQKKASMDYVDFWKSALVKRDADDAAMNEKSIARARAAAKERIEIRRQEMAAYAAQNEANYAIQAGSGGYGWRKDAQAIREGGRIGQTAGIGANMAVQGAMSGMSAKEIAEMAGGAALGGVAGAAAEHALSHGAIREIIVMMHEAVVGSYKRMLGSFMVLLSRIGGAAAASISIGAGVVIGGLAAISAPSYLRYHRAAEGQKESEQELKKKDEIASSVAMERLERLKAAKLVNDSEETVLKERIKNGDLTGAFDAINPLLMKIPAGQQKVKDAEEKKNLDREYETKRREYQMEEDSRKKQISLSDALVERARVYEMTKAKMATLDKDSVEYARLRNDLLEQGIESEKLWAEETKQRHEQEKQTEEMRKRWGEENKRIGTEYMRGWIGSSMDESEFPTIEQLAGDRFMGGLKHQYSPAQYQWKKMNGQWVRGKQIGGGSRPLNAGDGPFAGIAQAYESAKYAQIYDRIHGDIGGAESQRRTMIAARDQLIQAGAANPEMILGKIEDNTMQLKNLFDSMVKNGMIIRDSDGQLPPAP